MKIMTSFNNKILFVVLIVLLGGFILSRVFRAPSRESNFKKNLMTLDTAKVKAIHIFPAAEKKAEIKLVRSGDSWQVQREQRTAKAEMSQLKNVLGAIHKVHPDRVVSRTKEKWADYNVDSTGTQVKVFTDNAPPVEFWIGKTPIGTSYLRLEGKDDVYEVKETLNSYFNKSFTEWHDKSFLRVQTNGITRIAFNYPGDSSFIVRLDNKAWMLNNLKVDSSKVETYLNKFRSQNISEFADDFKPQSPPLFEVALNTDSATVLTVQAWKAQGDKWVLSSSAQEDVYFSSTDSFKDDLFVGRKTFLPVNDSSR